METGEFKQGGTGGFSLGSSAHIWGQETHNSSAFLLLLGWREIEYQSVSFQRYNTLGCCIPSSIMLALLSFHSPWQWPPGDKETSVPVPYFNAKLFAQLTISTCKGRKMGISTNSTTNQSTVGVSNFWHRVMTFNRALQNLDFPNLTQFDYKETLK